MRVSILLLSSYLIVAGSSLPIPNIVEQKQPHNSTAGKEPNHLSSNGKNESEFIMIGDMILLRHPNPDSRAAKIGFGWPKGEIPYKVSNTVAPETLEKAENAMKRLMRGTCIKFRKARANDKYWVNLNSNKDACFATVGWVNAPGGTRQQANFGTGCSEGNVVHELMHTLGLYHEQARNDRDQYVVIHEENIKEGHKHNFERSADRGYKTNSFRILYNYASIMHYPVRAFSKNFKNTIDIKPGHPKAYGTEMDMGQRKKITPADFRLMRAFYNCPNQGASDEDEGSLDPDEVHMVEDEFDPDGMYPDEYDPEIEAETENETENEIEAETENENMGCRNSVG